MDNDALTLKFTRLNVGVCLVLVGNMAYIEASKGRSNGTRDMLPVQLGPDRTEGDWLHLYAGHIVDKKQLVRIPSATASESKDSRPSV